MADAVYLGTTADDGTGDQLRPAFASLNARLAALELGLSGGAAADVDALALQLTLDSAAGASRVGSASGKKVQGEIDALNSFTGLLQGTLGAGAVKTQSGASVQAALDGMPALVSATVTAQADRAEIAADAAELSAGVYPDAASGLARPGGVVGGYFSVPSADAAEYLILYRHDAGPVATEIKRYPSASMVQAELSRSVVGHTPTAAGSSIANNNIYYWPGTLKSYAQRLSKIEVSMSARNMLALVVAFVEGDGTLTLVSQKEIALSAGLNTLAVDIYIPTGCIVGIGGGNHMYYEVGASVTSWSTTVVPTTSTAKTVSTTTGLRMRYTLDADTIAKSVQGANAASIVGGPFELGWSAPIVSTGSTVPANYTVFDRRSVEADGAITEITVGAAGPATMQILVASITSAGVATIVSSRSVALAAGVNVINTDIPVAVGQFIGFSNGYQFQNSANPQGVGVWMKNGAISNGDTLTKQVLHRFEIKWVVKSGLSADIHRAASMPGSASLGALALADPTGSVDATSVFASGRASDPQPYVRPGSFSITALPMAGGGLWGPGKVLVNGTRFFIPQQPQSRTLYHGLRAALQEAISAGDVLTLIGDSISHFAYASTGAAHWFNQLTRFANLGISADEPVMTALRPSGTYTPSFYGLSTAGTVSTGTRGPLGESLVLAAGASLSFTGAYEQVDVFYTQDTGAGSLAFQYNGGAAFKTVSAAGTLTLDMFSGVTATGQVASGTYSITASGGPVEITGLLRLGTKTAGAPPRLRTSRAAHGSYTFASFGAASRASIISQGTYAGGKVLPILALGINDSFGTSAATIVSNATAIIDALEAAGVESIYALPPVRPSSAWDASYTGGRTYDAAAGPLRKLYRQRGVQVVPLDALDWVQEGLLQDGLHPGDLGNEKFAQLVVEKLAGFMA